jgi:hypothetical protein
MMASIDCDNLRRIAHEFKGILRDDIPSALEAAAVEIERLQSVIERLHKERRAKAANR